MTQKNNKYNFFSFLLNNHDKVISLAKELIDLQKSNSNKMKLGLKSEHITANNINQVYNKIVYIINHANIDELQELENLFQKIINRKQNEIEIEGH